MATRITSPEMVETITALKAARRSLGLTQWQLGCLIGIRQPHVANVERLWNAPSPMLLALWKQALGVGAVRGFDWRAQHAAYLAYKAASYGRDAPVASRWPLEAVRQAVQVVRSMNLKALDDFIARGVSDSQAESDFIESLDEQTEMRVTVLCESSGWTRAEVDAVNHTITNEEQTAAGVTPEPVSEPPTPYVYVPYQKGRAPRRHHRAPALVKPPVALTPKLKRHRWRFYATVNGVQPVRAFLETLSDLEREAVRNIMKTAIRQGVDGKRVKRLHGQDFYEVVADTHDKFFRILFSVEGRHGHVWLAVSAFAKKTNTTPESQLDLTYRRLADWHARGSHDVSQVA